MDFALTGDQEILRDEIVRFATEALNDDIQRRDREQVFSRTLWERCGQMGLQGLPIPEEYGGSGLDPLSSALALEAFGYGCRDGGLVFSVGAHLCACAIPIWQHGSEEQKRKYLPGMCDGTLVAVHGITEPDSGSDAFSLRTRAERDGDGWRLNGTKMFASNGPVADLALVFAWTDRAAGPFGGITGFIVERGTAGFTQGPHIEKMGLRTSPMGELVFEDCWVPDSQVLGGAGGGASTFTDAMDWERTLLFACQLGTMRRLVEQSISYARSRRQFGQEISKFQAISHRIAEMEMKLEAARLLVYRAASKLGRTRGVSLDAAIAKLFVSESLVKTALDTMQIFGGYGYTAEYEVERTLRDALGSTLYSGTSEMQRNTIARWLGL